MPRAVIIRHRRQQDNAILHRMPQRTWLISKPRGADEGCSKYPSFGIAGSKTAQFCAQHAAEDMVHVKNKICRQEGCSKRLSFSMDGIKTVEFCPLHAAEHIKIKTVYETLNETSPTLSIPVETKGNSSKRHRTRSSKEVLGTTNGDHVKVEVKLEN